MIVVDASALIAILQEEPEGEDFLSLLVREPEPVIGAPTLLEARMVAARNPGGGDDVERLVRSVDIRVVSWTEDQVTPAFEAFARFGRGRHPAKLNFGDCMAYALAKSLGAPLLFKGGDFALTDIAPAFTGPLADRV